MAYQVKHLAVQVFALYLRCAAAQAASFDALQVEIVPPCQAHRGGQSCILSSVMLSCSMP